MENTTQENKFTTERINITKNHHQIIYHHDKTNIKAWYTSGAYNHNGCYCGEFIIRIKTHSFLVDDIYLRFTDQSDFIKTLNEVLSEV